MKKPSHAAAVRDKIHTYKTGYYNARGVVIALTDDAAGRVTVKLDRTGEIVKFHASDFEIIY